MMTLRPFVSILHCSEKAFILRFSDQIRNSLTQRLDNLQEFEIKELDKDILVDIIHMMKEYINVIDP